MGDGASGHAVHVEGDGIVAVHDSGHVGPAVGLQPDPRQGVVLDAESREA